MTQNLGAFFGDKAVKKKYVDRVRAHQAADHLIRGQGWTGTRGCAVGCTYEKYDHSRAPIETGTPEWLARIEDTLFESMSESKSRTFPEKFLLAIPVGADLEPVKAKFVCMLMEHAIKSVKSCKYDKKANPQVKAAVEGSIKAVQQMIAAQKSGDLEKITAARTAADTAAGTANTTAWTAETATDATARAAIWDASIKALSEACEIGTDSK
jgi:hypothetical protein